MTENVALERLEDQFNWYDRKSIAEKRAYRWLKLLEIVVAAAIPVVTTAGSPRTLIGALGAAVVVLEGVQHLFQFHANWITYRGTAEQLQHERYLYLAAAGPYARPNRNRLLAERVEGLVSQQHARWTASQTEPETDGKDATE